MKHESKRSRSNPVNIWRQSSSSSSWIQLGGLCKLLPNPVKKRIETRTRVISASLALSLHWFNAGVGSNHDVISPSWFTIETLSHATTSSVELMDPINNGLWLKTLSLHWLNADVGSNHDVTSPSWFTIGTLSHATTKLMDPINNGLRLKTQLVAKPFP